MASDCYVAPSADVIGCVRLEAEASVWFNAVVRGDNEPITIGRATNVQDGVVIHTDPGFPVVLGDRVTVGHQAVIHGATIGDETLIGIQAVILNGAEIGEHCLIGAGALVTEGMKIPDGSLVFGAPAKTIKPLSMAQQRAIVASAQVYVEKARRYRAELMAQTDL
ncbi:MAG: gamma carbonic anhydrase family protein [Gammaproteobacteria bacterium]